MTRLFLISVCSLSLAGCQSNIKKKGTNINRPFRQCKGDFYLETVEELQKNVEFARKDMGDDPFGIEGRI